MIEHLLPPRDLFVPERTRRRAWERRVRAAALAAPAALHLTHAECLDGAASDALLRASAGDAAVRTVWLDPHETLDALRLVTAIPGGGRRLVVTDLSMQKGQGADVARAVADLAAGGWRVEWRDHHARQWDGAPLEDLRAHALLTVELDGRECGASLLARSLRVDDAFWRRLVEAVRDHDLWLQQDPLGARLNDARREMGSEAFVARLLATRDVEDAEIAAAAERARATRDRLAATGLAEAKLVAAPGAVVGVAYGDLPTNDVLHALYADKGADVAILLKPEGTFSLRSPRGVDVCHRIAQSFGGGGHPNASGGTLGLRPLDLPAYWLLRDAHPRAKALVRKALEEAARARAD